MGTEIANTEQDLLPVLQSSIYPSAKPESINLAIRYCQANTLDIMQKPVHIVPMWDSNSRQMRDVIMPGIGLYRTQAARSGEYGGISEPEFGPDITEEIGGLEVTYPQWCKITVYRLVNGNKAAFSATERWRENYAVRGGQQKSIAPNAMWAKRPYGQLAKCTEAQALRKAFPECGAAPTAEEMEGKTHDFEPEERDITPAEPAKKLYPDDEFKKNFPAWESAIKDGKCTAEHVITMAESRGELSEYMKEQIRGIE